MKSRTALVTGASGGIGSAIVFSLLKKGYTVIGTYHSGEKTAQTLCSEAKEQGYFLRMIKTDLTDSASVNRLKENVNTGGNSVEVLVNCAGIARPKLFTDITDNDWREMIDTDLTSVFYMCRAFLPDMIEKKYGRIVNISSIWGVCGGACEADYSAAKAGVIGLSKALAKEVGLSGITVNVVAPGATATNMLARYTKEELEDIAAESSLDKIVTPEAVAEAVAYLVSEEAGFITGEVLNVNAGR